MSGLILSSVKTQERREGDAVVIATALLGLAAVAIAGMG